MEMKVRSAVYMGEVDIYIEQDMHEVEKHIFVSKEDAQRWVYSYVHERFNIEDASTIVKWKYGGNFAGGDSSEFTVGAREVVARIYEIEVYEVSE